MKYKSKDSPAGNETIEVLTQQVDAVYAAINRFRPSEMTSLAARIPGSPTREMELLKAYGEITLVIALEQVAEDLVIFNGDVKNLAMKLLASNRNTSLTPLCNLLMSFTIQGSSTGLTIANELKKLRINSRRGKLPRLVGGYAEARLFRALRLGDVAKIFIPDDDADALRLITRHDAFKSEKL